MLKGLGAPKVQRNEREGEAKMGMPSLTWVPGCGVQEVESKYSGGINWSSHPMELQLDEEVQAEQRPVGGARGLRMMGTGAGDVAERLSRSVWTLV